MQIDDVKSHSETQATPLAVPADENEIKVYAAAQTQPVTPACMFCSLLAFGVP